MRELRDAQRLAFEPHDGDRIGSERFPQDLDRHIAIEPRIAASIPLAHAAGPERADDLVLTEAGAGRERHRPLFYVTVAEISVATTARIRNRDKVDRRLSRNNKPFSNIHANPSGP